VRVPLPMAELWAEMQAQVEELTGQAGLQILRAILEDEVTRRVGPPHSKTGSCNGRYGKVWWPGCPHGTIDERWRVWWKATGSRRAA
jgi:hypothetical protein